MSHIWFTYNGREAFSALNARLIHPIICFITLILAGYGVWWAHLTEWLGPLLLRLFNFICHGIANDGSILLSQCSTGRLLLTPYLLKLTASWYLALAICAKGVGTWTQVFHQLMQFLTTGHEPLIYAFITGQEPLLLVTKSISMRTVFLLLIISNMYMLILTMRGRKELTSVEHCDDSTVCSHPVVYIGGYGKQVLSLEDIKCFLPTSFPIPPIGTRFTYVDHTMKFKGYTQPKHVCLTIPLHDLIDLVPVSIGRDIAVLHCMPVGSRASYKLLHMHVMSHVCSSDCSQYKTIFRMDVQPSFMEKKKRAMWSMNSKKYYSKLLTDDVKLHARKEAKKRHAQQSRNKKKKKEQHSFISNEAGLDFHSLTDIFPPDPVSNELAHVIVTGACSKMTKAHIEESGCAICGQLTSASLLVTLKSVKHLLPQLHAPGVSRQPRIDVTTKIKDYPIVIDHSCKYACITCCEALRKSKMPKFALARGLWLGAVPDVLKSLSFVEKMLVARVRHSCCSVRIASGMRKMKANAIAFRSPIFKIYNILPPPRSDLDEVLAIMFTGPSKPTLQDFARTPFLVRRNHVKHALHWLILNHGDYAEVQFSDENLNTYEEDKPPVYVQYNPRDSNKTREGTSLFDVDEEDGIEHGMCSFTVHGITGNDLDTLTTSAIKAKALHHLNTGGNFLAIGHSPDPESIWNNTQLYPQMFPWLFPYGLGGIGSVAKMSSAEHKRRLLMYHDKRFQTDVNFPFIAFSHEQIMTATTNSFLLAEKKIFGDISRRILSLNSASINDLLLRMAKEEHVHPESEMEKNCFQLLNDMDHVAGTVKGSTTSKKWMRNEIWSLIAHCGAPFWYITLSPADVKHPICLYYAGSNEKFEPSILPYDERMRRICNNPVACARFFHFIVTIFITDILGVGAEHDGLYGKTKAYYGTVEQQGRLGLHLHALIWLLGNLTPQEMRKLILDPQGGFQEKIINWIESCQMGEFFTGNHEEIKQRLASQKDTSDYMDPTETLPIPPPPMCLNHCNKCSKCTKLKSWWSSFKYIVDDILCRSNMHSCERGITKNGTVHQKTTYTTCRDNKYGVCKARFPRPTFEKTHVDPITGSLFLKKLEPWMNSVSSHLTYIFRCNTDVTSLWSGTALKAVVVYISEYITKSALKTHVMFDSIKAVFDKNGSVVSGSLSESEKARILLNKMVNLLSTKTEMGGPMVCMYLLGHPDHYTSHKFVPFYWRSFVNEAKKTWMPEAEAITSDKLTVMKIKNKIIGFSPVHDYIYRAKELEELCVYDWVRRCIRKRFNSSSYRRESTNQEHCGSVDMQEDSQTEDDDPDTQTNMKKKPANIHLFLTAHPLHISHASCLIPEDDKLVVNFIGGLLPRQDYDDDDTYYLTMLTLFKPWRSGLDLKSTHMCWSDAFNMYRFKARHKELMRNFNIRYECMDARDDFRAEMKKKFDTNFSTYENIELLSEHDLSDYEDEWNFPTLDDSNELGAKEKKMRDEKLQIRSVLAETGWLSTVTSTDADISCMPQHFNPSLVLTGSQWKMVIQKERQSVIDERQNANKLVNLSASKNNNHFIMNDVKIMNKSYLQKKFYVSNMEDFINSVCSKYRLNEEQEQAFKMIAHHSIFTWSEQMLLYIGGMAGTGKTQVIKAVTHFFSARGEAFRLISVAPTGSAAALLAGSTYHSVFGIHDQNGDAGAKTLSQIRTRLADVAYIFLDEVSMLSCHNLYKISSQLAKVQNKPDKPFGGLNLIFAGDFAQLPPPIGGEHVALYSRTVGKFTNTLRQQEEAMGLAVWHQVTNVTILRKNMRQQGMSSNDRKLRLALENMRYKDCTTNDIQFLKSCITSPLDFNKPNICDKNFRNASIITAKNSQKDEINRLGCIRFAQETMQELSHFFSEDCIRSRSSGKSSFKTKNLQSTEITEELQETIWNLPPSCGEKPVAGKLSICLGMPIIIKCNVATELCITNGQEGWVAGWQASLGSRKQPILDTIFIHLRDPPYEIEIKGLPKNIVPLSRTTNTIACRLPDDSKIYISRSQVEILANFAMTDYASQGKTRLYNPVDLINCRSHQAYYTALSRSACAEGTLILRGFNVNKITGRASQALRQEFRDLEFLDEISKLRYNDKLDPCITGPTRTMVISSYRTYRGMSYVPATLHKSLKWSKNDPWLNQDISDMKWQICKKLKKPSVTPSSISISFQGTHNQTHSEHYNMKKRKMQGSNQNIPIKRCKFGSSELCMGNDIDYSPMGLSWDMNSCSYDSVLTILHAIWWSGKNKNELVSSALENSLLFDLLNDFNKVEQGMLDLSTCRDNLREKLDLLYPHIFPWGEFAGVHELLEFLLQTNTVTCTSTHHCLEKHQTPSSLDLTNSSCMFTVNDTAKKSLNSWVNDITEKTRHRCTFCNKRLYMKTSFTYPLPLLAVGFSTEEMKIEPTIDLLWDNNNIKYFLRGVIYYGGYHFTSRIFSESGAIWFHDGTINGGMTIYEGQLNKFSRLHFSGARIAVAAVYSIEIK